MKFLSLALALASTAYSQSLSQVIASNPNLSSLGALLNNSAVVGNASALTSLTNITFLAPNNAAIAAFQNSSTAAALGSNSQLISAILSYHVIQGNYSNITNTTFLPTEVQPPTYANVTGGQRVEALVSGQNVTFFSGLLQNSSVVNASIPFSGGTVHVINRLLTLPQNVSATGVALNLTAAVGAVEQLNLTSQLDTTADLTLFLPNNAAFERLGGNLANMSVANLTQILSYHAVMAGEPLYSTNLMNGSSVQTLQGGNITIRQDGNATFVNNAQVILPNVLVSNGVIHVIDRLLNPNNSTAMPNTSTTVEAFPGATSATNVPFTSGVPTPTSTIAPAASSAQASASKAASSSSGAAWRPVETGALGMAALFGGAAAVMNL